MGILMGTGFLFVTTRHADYRPVNRLLMHLREWHNGDGRDDFCIITSRSPDEFRLLAQHMEAAPSENHTTSPPVRSDFGAVNEWAGASINEVESFCNKFWSAEYIDLCLYLVLDDKGLAGQTCILAERVNDWIDPGGFRIPHSDAVRRGEVNTDADLPLTNKCRLSWDDTYREWMMLDMVKSSWDEIVVYDEDREEEGGWWEYISPGSGKLAEGDQQRRDGAIRRLEEEGKC